MDDKKLEQQINEYAELAKENKKIDVASLMLSALKNESKNLVPVKTKRWAYLVSLGVPPFGLLFALKFYFSEEDDARQVANICILLTAVSVLLFWLMAKAAFSGSGASINQIEQIKPADIYELSQ